MRTSEQTNEISAALAKAQGEIQNPAKDKENPHYRSTYADLASGINAIRYGLSKHGIAFVQAQRMEGDMLLVDTRLTHSSGQWIEGEYPVCRFPAKPQDIMSALTYARRGSLFALVGIAGDDDDGNEANKQEITAGKPRVPKPPAPPRDIPEKREPSLSQEGSQVARDAMIEAIDMAQTAEDLAVWAVHNKAAIDRLFEADKQAVRNIYGDKLQELKGKKEAA